MLRKTKAVKDAGTLAMSRSVRKRGHWMAKRVAWARNLAGSVRYRLPFNPRLLAFNVVELPVPLEPILAARRLYEQAVEPELHRENQGFRSGGLAFHVRRPDGWGSDIKWISCDDTDTYECFRAVFDALGVAERMRERIDHDRAIRIYNAFFVTRSRCDAFYPHMDYGFAARTNAYTLMTPLYDHSQSASGHLIYHDLLDRTRGYTYQLGRAIIFGAGFRHATAPMLDAGQRVFLCFTFGSDKWLHWQPIYRSVAGQSRLTWGPDGEWIANW